jgi:hypothetical protein
VASTARPFSIKHELTVVVRGEEFVGLEESAPPGSTKQRTSISAQRLAAQLLADEDREFLEALRKCGLLVELDAEELLRVASEVEESDEDSRRMDLLEVYFEGGGDPEVARRRQLADRFFVQKVGEPATAAGLVERLVALLPELGAVKLERIGGGDGPLVLRAGDHFAAVLDEYEEETDTDEFDLKEAAMRNAGVPMVTVRGLVRALNVLLDRHGVRERLVSLNGDDKREAYISLGLTEAVQLAQDGHLEDEDASDVMTLGAW